MWGIDIKAKNVEWRKSIHCHQLYLYMNFIYCTLNEINSNCCINYNNGNDIVQNAHTDNGYWLLFYYNYISNAGLIPLSSLLRVINYLLVYHNI